MNPSVRLLFVRELHVGGHLDVVRVLGVIQKEINKYTVSESFRHRLL